MTAPPYVLRYRRRRARRVLVFALVIAALAWMGGALGQAMIKLFTNPAAPVSPGKAGAAARPPFQGGLVGGLGASGLLPDAPASLRQGGAPVANDGIVGRYRLPVIAANDGGRR